MVDRGSLYYLLHTRMSAATAYGCRKSGGRLSAAGAMQRCAEYLPDIAVVLLLAWVHVGIICAITALLWATTEALGAHVSWHVCLGLVMRMPLQVLARTAAVEGSILGQVLCMLIIVQFHVQPLHCRYLSVLCVCCLPGNADLGGILAAVAAWYDPAFPNPSSSSWEELPAEEAIVVEDMCMEDVCAALEASMIEFSSAGVALVEDAEEQAPEISMRTEEETKQLLGCLQQPLVVREAETWGRNSSTVAYRPWLLKAF